ncbi:MAG TPA: c-type cytochrome [Steroidobacteraceae bacterium]|nr:c-type cytochrome [Steroidobacteraceae bacterium]
MAIGLGSLAVATAFGQQAQLKGDAQRGRTVAYTCLGCHGIEGYRNAYPDYAVPRLRGQSEQYIISALHEYKSGLRDHPTMRLQASSLSDQDIADVAAYFSGKPLVATGTSKRPVPKEAQLCVSCHGTQGVAISPMYPNLAGQHASYLARAIQEYHDLNRKHPIMDGIAATLKPAEITVIADYFSSLRPGLHAEPRPFFSWEQKSPPAQR